MNQQMKFLSGREISNLGVPYYVVLEACQTGQLSAQRLGPAFAVFESDALAFVAEYKKRMDPHNAAQLEAKVTELEAKVIALGGTV